MYDYEKHLLKEGFSFICGCDEAGRGPLAGPVVAGAVILNPKDLIEGLNDSKQLSKAKREFLYEEIVKRALAYQIAYISNEEIDRVNIYQASKIAMLNAISRLDITPDFILSDAMPLHEANIPYLAIVKGDTLSASIAAASILAKVSRDHFMEELGKKYPLYGFEKHKGYPTKEHVLAINTYGILPIHRKTYEPVKSLLVRQTSLDL
ncbi:MAG: ribonuclease HII [Candidatus Izemoplasmatales bacterium]|nr:ribonuclease HII [Candidatus Izemoplasmatales bacterium]